MASPGYFPVLLWLLLVILLEVVLPVRGELCYQSTGYRSYYIYCSSSCCGYYYNEYCCGYDLTGGAIAGIVIGSLFGIAMLVTLIVCLCAACNKSGTTRGRVVYPNATTQPSVAVVNTTNHTSQGPAYPQPGAAYPSQGQAYPPYGAYPPQGQAYPPPPPAYPPPEHGVPPPKYSAN